MEIMLLEVKIMFHIILFALCLGITAILTQNDMRNNTHGTWGLLLAAFFIITLFFFVPLEITYWFLRWIFLSDNQVFYEYLDRLFSEFSVFF